MFLEKLRRSNLYSSLKKRGVTATAIRCIYLLSGEEESRKCKYQKENTEVVFMPVMRSVYK
jgi:hypothetical protein